MGKGIKRYIVKDDIKDRHYVVFDEHFQIDEERSGYQTWRAAVVAAIEAGMLEGVTVEDVPDLPIKIVAEMGRSVMDAVTKAFTLEKN